MSDLSTPCILDLPRKRLLLRTLCSRLMEDYPNESEQARELLRDIEHDLRRADAAERELARLKRTYLLGSKTQRQAA